MSRGLWNTIKHSKTFYIRLYRSCAKWVIISLSMNIMLIIAIYYVHTHEPEPDFYATSGIALPVQLTPLTKPNYSNTFLLDPDPVDENEVKTIPQ